MIREIEIRDLVVIERAHIEPAQGLTAITGETGAGKTVVAQALGLLAGGPVDPRAVRPGARHALVQATVAVPDGFWDALDSDDPALQVRDLAEDPTEVVVARRVPAEGRARALVDGQVASRDGVAAFVGALVRFSGQHEQRRLVGPGAQAAILDAFAGPEVVGLATRLISLRRHLVGLTRSMAEARDRRERAAREREALEMLVADVDAVRPDPDEEASLLAERGRLAHSERLAEAAASVIALLDGDGDRDGGAVTAAGRAWRTVGQAAELDPSLRAPLEDLAAGEAALQEALIFMRRYVEDLDAEPGRLEWVETRLDEYRSLGRRYGPGTEVVINRAEEARAALDALITGAAGDDALANARADALAAARATSDDLHAARRDAAPRLAERVQEELQDLAMSGAVLRVEVTRDDAEVPADRVSLMIRPNPGLPESPLAETASGGELSRVLLALHSVAAAAEPGVAWVFDEVDAGIGGVTAGAVGTRLADLAVGRQVMVITHLPQVAAAADRHYRLVKGRAPDGRAVTTIEPVEGEGLIEELCRMLGASAGDEGARRHAEELIGRRGR